VHSTRELDFDAALRPFGLQLVKKRKGEHGEDAEGATPWIGVETETKEGLVAVKHVYEESPAALAGLDAGDLLLALDGYRVAPDSFKKRLRGMEPGREVDVSLFRRDRLENVRLKLGKQYELEYAIEPTAGAGKRQVQLRNGWLGTPLEKKGAGGRGSEDRAETASSSPTPGT
jgi:predicted metalloprotease with PDZ domain